MHSEAKRKRWERSCVRIDTTEEEFVRTEADDGVVRARFLEEFKYCLGQSYVTPSKLDSLLLTSDSFSWRQVTQSIQNSQ